MEKNLKMTWNSRVRKNVQTRLLPGPKTTSNVKVTLVAFASVILTRISGCQNRLVSHNLWEFLNNRYTIQIIASKCVTITSIDEICYATWNNIAEYYSKYYSLTDGLKDQSITIDNSLKIQTLNNLWPPFKTYLIVVYDRIRKNKKLDMDNVLFKASEEEETHIKTNYRASANCVSTKSNATPQVGVAKDKIEFVKWLKCKKCDCKHLTSRICKNADEECDRYHKRIQISRCNDS